MKISVVILTRNEEINIERCLASLKRFDDVHVIDSFSTDHTPKLALQNGAVVHYREFDHFSGQRNFAHASCELKYEWALHLDADEVMTDELCESLELLNLENDAIDCYEIPSKLMFMNKFLRYASGFPVYQVRLLKTSMSFQEIGHGQKEICDASRIGRIDSPYLHFNFSHGIAEWLTKHIGYAQKEAQQITLDSAKNSTSNFLSYSSIKPRHFLKTLFNKTPFLLRPFVKFIYLYVFKLGILDGRSGLLFCTLQLIYELMIFVFYYLNRLSQ